MVGGGGRVVDTVGGGGRVVDTVGVVIERNHTY